MELSSSATSLAYISSTECSWVKVRIIYLTIWIVHVWTPLFLETFKFLTIECFNLNMLLITISNNATVLNPL
jgi:hypothetical protein